MHGGSATVRNALTFPMARSQPEEYRTRKVLERKGRRLETKNRKVAGQVGRVCTKGELWTENQPYAMRWVAPGALLLERTFTVLSGLTRGGGSPGERSDRMTPP